MRKTSAFAVWVSCVMAAGLYAGVIVPTLNDTAAIGNYTAARNGVLNELPDITSREMTLAARFKPDISQATSGPVIVIENGGTSNGTGLYLSNGSLVFCAKADSGRYGLPTSLRDTNFTSGGTDIGKAMAVDLGRVTFGTENTVYASMNLNNGELLLSYNGFTRLYTITGYSGTENLDGNRTGSFLGVSPVEAGHMGGLLEEGLGNNAAALWPYLFWSNVTPMVQTAGYANQRGQIFNQAVRLVTLPHDPIPANGAISVDPDTVTQLTFTKANDPNNIANPSPYVTGHWVTVYADFNGEPNFLAAPLHVSALLPAGTGAIAYPYAFEQDETVHWQVEEQIQGHSKGDPGNIAGVIWTFKAVGSLPSVTVSPTEVLQFPATHPAYEGPAVLSCQFVSKSALTAVQWYRSSAPASPISDADPDITVTLTQNGDNYTSTLSIANIALEDADDYWCYVQNTAGNASSESANLAIKRQVAHWTLDESDLVGGLYLDSSGEGHHAAPDAVPASSSFVDGVDPAETGDGLDFAVNPLTVADANSWAPSQYTGQVSISAWLKWAGSNGGWQGVVSNRSTVGATTANFYIEIRQDNGRLQIGGIAGAGDVSVDPLPVGEWTHLVITVRAGELVIYIDGQPQVTNTAAQAVFQNIVPVRIGALNRDTVTGNLLSPYNGVMDDVQLFNYALSISQAADIYFDVVETPVCLNLGGLDLRFDLAGGGAAGDEPDCRISLPDLVALAGTWLNCGLYPACP